LRAEECAVISRTIDKKKVAKEIESGSTVISSITNDMKTTAQSAELTKFMNDAKKQLSRGKSMVLVAISADRVSQG